VCWKKSIRKKQKRRRRKRTGGGGGQQHAVADPKKIDGKKSGIGGGVGRFTVFGVELRTQKSSF